MELDPNEIPSSQRLQACEEETKVIDRVKKSSNYHSYCAELRRDKRIDKLKLLNPKRGMKMWNSWWGLEYTGNTESSRKVIDGAVDGVADGTSDGIDDESLVRAWIPDVLIIPVPRPPLLPVQYDELLHRNR
jgi:hypothetical protein